MPPPGLVCLQQEVTIPAAGPAANRSAAYTRVKAAHQWRVGSVRFQPGSANGRAVGGVVDHKHGEDLRLPVQAAADRRLGRGQDLRPVPLLRGRLQRHLHLHHR